MDRTGKLANTIQPSCWMQQLLLSSPELSRCLPLCHLAIPGTHDTGTWALSSKSTLYIEHAGSSLASTLKRLTSVPGLGGGVKGIVARWARTQTVDAYSQLRSGIRYFDLRILCKTKGATSPTFWLTHGLHETNVCELLDDVLRFLTEYTCVKSVIRYDWVGWLIIS
jgi:hypothetical protein